MPSPILHDRASSYVRKVPDIRPGFTIRVHERIQEGNKERTQVFEGLVIAVHRGHVATDASFTVRRVVSGIGVEKVFPLHSPSIEKIEVKKIAKVRRARLTFLRGRSGKSARMIERYTSADEFAVEEEKPKAEAAQPEKKAEGSAAEQPAEAPKAEAAEAEKTA